MRKNILISAFLFFSIISQFLCAQPPSAQEVFIVKATRVDPNSFTLSWSIKPGFYLYKDRIQLKEGKNKIFTLGKMIFPASQNITDRQGHTSAVYQQQLTLPVPVLGQTPGEDYLNVQYQGCAEDGFCYPPQTKRFQLSFDKEAGLSRIQADSITQAPPTISEPTATSPSSIEKVFSSHNLFLIIASFFGFGLLLSFTPCVLPMIPVLSGVIVGHGKNISTRKAFFLSLSYVLSMSATYALVGAVIASLGSNLQIIMQSPISIGIFSAIFVLLALSMFDFFELRLPSSIQNKLAGFTRSQNSGHYLSAAVLGVLSTLVLSPCVTAPLIGALSYIAQSGDKTLGVLALFFMGLGMGCPLLLIGTSAGKLLPKAGIWMNSVKSFFGVLLLAIAIYTLSRILPPPLTMALWGILSVFTGVYLGALLRSNTRGEKFRQASGIIILVYGVAILIGSSKGNINPFQPLANENALTVTAESKTPTAQTLAQAKEFITKAKGQPVLIDFYADWCTSCKVIAATTLRDKQVQHNLEKFAYLTVDLSSNNAESKALLDYFNVIAPPTFIFLDNRGKEIKNLRLVGEVSAEALIAHSKFL
jgi:thiol:disulfide interchange protein DsbD